MHRDGSWICGDRVAVVGVRVRVGVAAHIVRELLVDAASATMGSALDAGVVEGGVVRAEVAVAAVPQRRHCYDGLDRLD